MARCLEMAEGQFIFEVAWCVYQAYGFVLDLVFGFECIEKYTKKPDKPSLPNIEFMELSL